MMLPVKKQNWIAMLLMMFFVVGCTNKSMNTQTVSTNGYSWTKMDIVGKTPLPRDAQAMTYDSDNNIVILFSGKGRNYYDDTWSYDIPMKKWSSLNPQGLLPPARFGQAMCYDTSGKITLLFGGVLEQTGQPANDMWSYDSHTNKWQLVKPLGNIPQPRVYQSFTATQLGKSILFGGWNGNDAFNDTWSYDSATNSWKNLNPLNPPPNRWGQSMAYNTANGKLLLFGGLFGSYDGTNRLNDTWEYNPTTSAWKNLQPHGDLPPARGYASMVYAANTGTFILFGGFAGENGMLGDVWEYNPTTNFWHKLSLAGVLPEKRDFSSMVYAHNVDTIVLFGGLTGEHGNVDGTLLNDTWEYSFAQK